MRGGHGEEGVWGCGRCGVGWGGRQLKADGYCGVGMDGVRGGGESGSQGEGGGAGVERRLGGAVWWGWVG